MSATVDSQIVVGDGALEHLEELVSEHFADAKKFVLLDENTFEHCWPLVLEGVPSLKEAGLLEVEAGEQSKDIEVCTNLWRVLVEQGADRNSLLVNLGGGVITDLGGFVASTFKRGIAFVHVPTTFLGMVDAALGGKTGVDLDDLKNQVGTFAAAVGTYMYPPFLATLSTEQQLSGYAEVLKHALIVDAELWAELKAQGTEEVDWLDVIQRSVQIKLDIVQDDPMEQGDRKLLNFGHTVGHAVEGFQNEYQNGIEHGYAVAFGMVAEGWLSLQKAGLPEKALEEIVEVVNSLYEYEPLPDEAKTSLEHAMQNDKKNEGGNINFTLLEAIGKGSINHTATVEEAMGAIEYAKSRLMV